MSILHIRAALADEIKAASEMAVFIVRKVTRVDRGFLLNLEPKATRGNPPPVLDDSFGGANVSWTDKVKSVATVKRVISESGQLILHGLNGVAPAEGTAIFVYRRDFLTPLLKCWEKDEWAIEAFESLSDLGQPRLLPTPRLNGKNLKILRTAQRSALAISNYSSSYLWGPPGTGKTHTIGFVIAEYLVANPMAKVLFLSTTNQAVDDAVIAVDTALEYLKQTDLRSRIKRHGSGFSPNKFLDRQHLLPTGIVPSHHGLEDVDFVAIAALLYEKQFRPNLKSFDPDRLIAMTTTRAIQKMAKLKELGTFGLLVFDESSQIGLAHTLMLMPLAEARMFAGDPKQLSPIAKSNTEVSKRWLKRSTFAYQPSDGPSLCLLTEQSRMGPLICKVVSQTFYDGKLRVADDALDDLTWHQARSKRFGAIGKNEQFVIESITTDGAKNAGTNGWIRQESADLIVKMIISAIHQQHAVGSEILVVTPFCSQAEYILEYLYRQNLRAVEVSTVHAVQGGQKSIVFFDPVYAGHSMLMNHEGRRLINVALSRAKAKVILPLSAGDMVNPVFAQIRGVLQTHVSRSIRPLAQVLEAARPYARAIGERVYVNSHKCEIIDCTDDGSIICAVDEGTGEEFSFSWQELAIQDRAKVLRLA